MREEKIFEDIVILKLSKFVFGNYIFSLVVVDFDGVINFIIVNLIVNKVVDYFFVVNVGFN